VKSRDPGGDKSILSKKKRERRIGIGNQIKGSRYAQEHTVRQSGKL